MKNILKNAGLRATRPRIAIMEFMDANSEHCSAYDVQKSLELYGIRLPLATVYRTMDALTDIGFLRKFNLASSSAVYERVEEERHDHLLCDTCGKIVEFTAKEADQIHQKIATDAGFILETKVTYLHGKCGDCQNDTK